MRVLKIVFLILIVSGFLLTGFRAKDTNKSNLSTTYVTVLGIAQDGGYPQIDCEKSCCQAYHQGSESKKLVSSIGLVDLDHQKKWLFDATPDMVEQMQRLKGHLNHGSVLDGIFLTHAHIGHYTGLMFLGHEAMGANEIPVFAMPKMSHFLKTNGPWSQLVDYRNIILKSLTDGQSVELNNHLKVTPFLVPHRDEYSETVGYKIEGADKSLLYIPDINKWEIWKQDIVDEVKKVDYALLDATFLKEGEIARPMADVPHPFISETVKLFEKETLATKRKIHFIHLNHTNPAIKERSKLKDSIESLGFNFAKEGMNFSL